MKPQKPTSLFRLCSRMGGLVFPIIVSLFLCSCTTVDSVTKKIDTGLTEEKPETFYVGLDGLKLFPEPRFCRAFIARLPLHEEVVRDKLEKGFAHVRVVSTGQTGWVNNAHLLWRISAPPKPLPPEPLPRETVSPEPPLREPVSPEPPPAKKASEENVIQAPSQPNPEVEGRDASIFNRF